MKIVNNLIDWNFGKKKKGEHEDKSYRWIWEGV